MHDQQTIYIDEPFKQSYSNIEQDPEKYKDFSENVDVGDLHDDLNYLLICPFTSWNSFNPDYYHVAPYIFTYRNEDTKVADIIKFVKQQDPSLQKKVVSIHFRNHLQISKWHSLQDIKKQLKREDLYRVCLFVNSRDRFENEDSDDDQYIDESSLLSYLTNQPESGSMKYFEITIEIVLAGKKVETMPLQIDPEYHGKEIIEDFIKKMKTDYSYPIKQADIREISIKGWFINAKFKRQEEILRQPIYHKKTTLIVNLFKPPAALKKNEAKDYNSYLTIYKEGQKELDKFKYSQIAHLTFEHLYKQRLQIASSKKKDAVYGLKIEDMIISPLQKISKAEAYFKSVSKQPLSVVGKVVTEKMIFYHHIPKLIQKRKQFSLEDLNIPEQEIPKRKACRQKATDRAKVAPHQYFKKLQNVEPILIYTSELKYQEKNGQCFKIYESLNRFLRENSLLTLKQSAMENEWRYLYASTLLRHLDNINRYSGKVYRGVTYDPQAKVGNIMTFKPFLSTSTKKDKAIEFAKSGTAKVKHLFEFQILQGYPIKDYSIFIGENEILLQPFTEFQVKKIRKEYKDGSEFRIYELSEIETSKELPMIRSNMIVWIDKQNAKEAQQIYNSVEKNDVSFLKQIFSTDELKQWLKRNTAMLKDPQVNVIFLSNMSREEKNGWNSYAGIQGLQQVRKYSTRAPFFFYIGNKEVTIKKLEEKKASFKGVEIGNHPNEVKAFLKYQMRAKS